MLAPSERRRPIADRGGAGPGDCNGGNVTTIKLPGGTLDMGYEVCEGVGASPPWAVWTPNSKK